MGSLGDTQRRNHLQLVFWLSASFRKSLTKPGSVAKARKVGEGGRKWY